MPNAAQRLRQPSHTSGISAPPRGMYVQPDTGKACSTYDADANQCPYPRCTIRWDEGSVTSQEICDTSTCSDFFQESSCDTDKTCSWSTVVGACYTTADGIPCDRYYTDAACNADKTCAWSTDLSACSGKDTGKACKTYVHASSPVASSSVPLRDLRRIRC